MELKTTKEFILKIHSLSNKHFKSLIEKEFPKAFEPEFGMGKWCYCKRNNSEYLFQKVDDKSNKVWGFNDGVWRDANHKDSNWYWFDFSDVRLATPEEVKAMLLKEAEKRGYKEGVSIIYVWSNKKKYKIKNGIFFLERSLSLIDTSCDHGNYVFHKGKWAEIVNENNEILERIETIQKGLEELKEKLK